MIPLILYALLNYTLDTNWNVLVMLRTGVFRLYRQQNNSDFIDKISYHGLTDIPLGQSTVARLDHGSNQYEGLRMRKFL